MSRYYIHIGDQLEGPFNLAALKEKHITRSTMVWVEGQGDWMPAGKLKELNKLFAPLPIVPIIKGKWGILTLLKAAIRRSTPHK